jgi:hypothetical protein
MGAMPPDSSMEKRVRKDEQPAEKSSGSRYRARASGRLLVGSAEAARAECSEAQGCKHRLLPAPVPWNAAELLSRISAGHERPCARSVVSRVRVCALHLAELPALSGRSGDTPLLTSTFSPGRLSPREK